MKHSLSVLSAFFLLLSLPLAAEVVLGSASPTAPALPAKAGEIDPDLRWAPGFGPSGCNGPLFDVVAGDAGEIYVGGLFSECGGVSANNVARFDSATGTWSALGSGGGNGVDARVRALAVMGGVVYVGGEFTQANLGAPIAAQRIARWDGVAWTALGSGGGNGVDNTVLVLEVAGGVLYAGGNFDVANVGAPITVNRIARWDGVSWSALGSNGGAGLSSNVFAIEEVEGEIFVGGAFLEANAGNPVAARFLARWDGTEWSSLDVDGGGINNSVSSLLFAGGQLYVGGGFTRVEAGPSAALYVARWNPIDGWSSLGSNGGSGVSSPVGDLAMLDGDLYVSGVFTLANFGSATGAVPASRIARWDGSSWSPVGSEGGEGLDNGPNAMTVSGGALFVAGLFGRTNLGGEEVSVRSIAAWNGSSWSAEGPKGVAPKVSGSLSSRIYAVASSGDFVYFGGLFSAVGGVPANNLARYQRSTGTWSALGTGIGNGTDNAVRALLVDGEDLYVGGDFSEVNVGEETAASRLARWDGTTWHPVGSGAGEGLDSQVLALARCGGDVYVGGSFDEANLGEPVVANRLARWDGASWSAVGSGAGNGLSGPVFALACDGDDLYAGGSFLLANLGESLPVHRLARWDGQAWHALGSEGGDGANGFVFALGARDGELYVGGSFGQVNVGNPLVANHIARWDGVSWSTLEGGPSGDLNAVVRSISLDGDDLYVGGDFTTAGGVPASRLAHWTGSHWAGLGSGVDGPVWAMELPTADELIVGGELALAGGRPSSRLGFYSTRAELAVAVDAGLGRVTSSPAGIDCPGSCTARFHFDTPIALTATPEPGYLFEQWSGACAGDGPCEIALADDESLGVSFEIAPETDLGVMVVDLRDPLPAGVSLIYTVEVTNQSAIDDSTDVFVTAPLPPGTELVETQGCLDDSVGSPVCRLGLLAPGASVSFTIEASVSPGAGEEVTFEACVASANPDPNAANDCASEATSLDLVPPQVVGVEALGSGIARTVGSCQTLGQRFRFLRVGFSEAMADPGADVPASVTNPGSYRWVRPAEGLDLSTIDCDSPPGSDVPVAIESVEWNSSTFTATLIPGRSEALPDGLYHLLVCGELGDAAGNPLGGTSVDVGLTFRLDTVNFLADGHFDRFDPLACNLDAWDSSDISRVEIAEPDVSGSPLSGSAGQTSAEGFDLAQCVPLQGDGFYRLSAAARADGGTAVVELFCEPFAAEGCTGPALGSAELQMPVVDTGAVFDGLELEVATPPGTVSALCGAVAAPGSADQVFVDDLVLGFLPLFADGFESGDFDAWTSVVP